MENKKMLEEIDVMIKGFKDIPFDKALPLFQNKLWEVSSRYGKAGDKALGEYFDWKSK